MCPASTSVTLAGGTKTNKEVQREQGINSNKWLLLSTLLHILRRLLCLLPGIPVTPDALLFCLGTEATSEPVQHITIPNQQVVTNFFCPKCHTHTHAVKNPISPSQIGTGTQV